MARDNNKYYFGEKSLVNTQYCAGLMKILLLNGIEDLRVTVLMVD